MTYEVVQDDGTPLEFIDLIHRSVSIPPGLAWNLRSCLSCSASLSCFALIIVVLLRCVPRIPQEAGELGEAFYRYCRYLILHCSIVRIGKAASYEQ